MLEGTSRSIDHLGVVLTGGKQVRDLNRRYKGVDYDTDVLAFSLRGEAGDAFALARSEGDGTGIDGEIYVNLDFAREHCAEFDASFEEEALRYVIHGLLHLLGYDDADDAGRTRMRTREDAVLRLLPELDDDLADDAGALHDVEVDTGHSVVE